METRLVAIMLTDMRGYTEFSSRSDRKEVVAAVRQQQALIAPAVGQFRGRLIKWIGDAALATFASATDAILCGRNIQSSFIENAERGRTAIAPAIKVVVHVGDVMVDQDGDIYGDAVNFLARMEKAADSGEVYFSEAVRRVMGPGEIPYEPVGEFEFKGISEKARIYRTCFGQTPVVRERVVLVQTNFVGVQELADQFGWDVVHPVLDRCTDMMLEAVRRQEGTNRGALQIGCFFTFNAVKSCLRAVKDWDSALSQLETGRLAHEVVKIRVGVHLGTLHVMKHTMMGQDIDMVRTLSALGSGDQILLTDAAVDTAGTEGIPYTALVPFGASEMRNCGSKRRWLARYPAATVFELKLNNLATIELG